MKQRLQYLDVCKGMGILLVVLGHIFLTNPVKTWIFSFHMPFFFFLSGYIFYFHKINDFGSFVKKRFKAIVIPYFMFASIWYIYWLLIERKVRPDSMDVNKFKPLLGIFYGIGSDTWLIFNIVLWFLPCLFITEIIFYLIAKNVKKDRNIISILLTSSIIGYIVSIYLGFRFPWGINIVFTSIVFYGLGYILHRSNLENKLTPVREYILIILLLVINIPIGFINGPVSMGALVLGNYFLYYIAATSGTLFLYFISRKLPHYRWLSFLGRNSLIILCIHEPIKRIVIKIISVYIKIPVDTLRNSILGSMLCLAILMLVLIPAIFIINRYLPFLLGKRFIKKDNI